jgi:CRISPR-associated protein Csb2
MKLEYAVSALSWLEQQMAPDIIAPTTKPCKSKYRLYVPDNVGDKVAASWCRGGDANIADYRTEKDVRSVHLITEAVHYLYKVAHLDTETEKHLRTLLLAARSITHLGWGIDMVVGNASVISEDEVPKLQGERWQPNNDIQGNPLRVPAVGTLQTLMKKHTQFLNRITPEGLRPAAQSTPLKIVGYRRTSDAPARPFAAFSVLMPDASGLRSFSTSRRACAVAGMMRHAATSAAQAGGWPKDKIGKFVLGHGESQNGTESSPVQELCGSGSTQDGRAHVPVEENRRFAYLPLPSIEFRGSGRDRVVGNIRRVIVTTFADDCASEVAWTRRALAGGELIDKDSENPIALLSLIAGSENVVQCYTRNAATWATVTPVVLPGFDDPAHYRRRLKKGTDAQEQKRLLESLQSRTESLIRKAIIQAGFSQTLADHAELEWRKAGFWPGTELADSYTVPNHLKRFPRFHVKIHWRDGANRSVQVPGVVCLGGGRYYGIGLFAAAD